MAGNLLSANVYVGYRRQRLNKMASKGRAEGVAKEKHRCH